MEHQSKHEAAPLAVIEFGPDLVISGWNRRAEQTFATSKADALGRGLAEVLPLADGAEAWRALLAGADDEGPRVWAIDRPDASLMFEAWSEVTRDDAGEPLSVTLYGYDATARVAAELRASLESTMLTAVKENLEITMWAIDRSGTFLYEDGKGLRGVGVSPHERVGMNVFELYKDQDFRNNEQMVAALAGQATHDVYEAHGRHWEMWFTPLTDNPNRAAVVSITLDMTEARRHEAEMRARLELIERQQEVIRQLATPIIEVWDGVLTMPIIGLVDTARTAEIMDSLLQAVTQTRARFAILDLTGVEVVDTGTASHLIKMLHAVRLLGAEGILSGIHPRIAQTMVALGIDLSHVAVHASLRDSLKHCIKAGP